MSRDLAAVLAESLERVLYHHRFVSNHRVRAEALAFEALAFARDQLPTREEFTELFVRVGIEVNAVKLADAILRDLWERLGG